MYSRFITGLGVGALSAIVPLYAEEVALKKLPGSLLVLYQVQIAHIRFLLGLHRRPWNVSHIILIPKLCSSPICRHHFKSSASWRFHIGLQLIWGAFLIVGGCLPESPRLLFGRGDEPKALKAVARLNERKVGDPLTRDVIKDLEEAIREENEGGKAGWLECFSTRSMSEFLAFLVLSNTAEKYNQCGREL